MRCGIRGAKSSLPPFSHTWAVGSGAFGSTFTSDARRLRNDRSSSTKTWRFLPQRKVRYVPFCAEYVTGMYSRKALTPAFQIAFVSHAYCAVATEPTSHPWL